MGSLNVAVLSRWLLLGALVSSTVVCSAFAQTNDGDAKSLDTCPSVAGVLTALQTRGISSGDLRLRIEHSPQNAHEHTLYLESASGAPLLQRTIESTDCAAILKAFALVVEGYFVDVGTLEQHREESADSVPVSTAATPAPQKNPQPAPVAIQVATTAPEPFRPPPTRSARTLQLLFGLGSELLPASGQAALAGQAGGGVAWPDQYAFGHLVLGTSGATTLGSLPNRVSRWSSRASLRVGLASHSKPQFLGWLAAGAELSRLRALDVEQASTQTTVSPVFVAGGTLSFDIARAWAFQTELSCGLLAVRDRYDISPDGEIGHGPRITCALLGNFLFSQGGTDHSVALGSR